MPSHPCGSTVQRSPKGGVLFLTGNAGGLLFLLWPLACVGLMVWMMWGMGGSAPGPADHTHDDGLTHGAHVADGPLGLPAGPCQHVFGSHVASCGHKPTGFTGQHNPSHHRGPTATHTMSGTPC